MYIFAHRDVVLGGLLLIQQINGKIPSAAFFKVREIPTNLQMGGGGCGVGGMELGGVELRGGSWNGGIEGLEGWRLKGYGLEKWRWGGGVVGGVGLRGGGWRRAGD